MSTTFSYYDIWYFLQNLKVWGTINTNMDNEVVVLCSRLLNETTHCIQMFKGKENSSNRIISVAIGGYSLNVITKYWLSWTRIALVSTAVVLNRLGNKIPVSLFNLLSIRTNRKEISNKNTAISIITAA